jgi:hypothetical protein
MWVWQEQSCNKRRPETWVRGAALLHGKIQAKEGKAEESESGFKERKRRRMWAWQEQFCNKRRPECADRLIAWEESGREWVWQDQLTMDTLSVMASMVLICRVMVMVMVMAVVWWLVV